MSNPQFHQCSTCGYEWKHGQHGGHNCAATLDTHYEALLLQVTELRCHDTQSAEKIARLEAENKELRAWKEKMQDGSRLCIENAAAELSNRQLREQITEYLAFDGSQGTYDATNVYKARIELRALLDQPISTKALDAYVANFNPWISVKTKLPDHRQEVLARETDGCIYELWFIQERDESCAYNSWYDEDGNRYGDIAHWMPLPPAPEKE